MYATYYCMVCGEDFEERPIDNECPVCGESMVVHEYAYDGDEVEY